MADKKMYKVGITVKEPWAADISYEVLDVTLYAVESGGDGCSYIAIRANQGVTPGTDDTVWVKATQRGQSIYDLAVKYGDFEGTEAEFEAEYEAALHAAQSAAQSASDIEAQVETNEAARATAERARSDAETARSSAETARINAENARNDAESLRDTAESDRVRAESGRVTAEASRVEAETFRQGAEQSRRQQFEGLKTDMNTAIDNVDAKAAEIEEDIEGYEANEAGRVSAENARVAAEAARVSAEQDRATAETARQTAEGNRATAETERASAEGARTTAEQGRVSAEQGRVSAESGRVSAESERVAAETARESASATAVQNAETATAAANTAAEHAEEAATTIDEKIAGKAEESEVSQLRQEVDESVIGPKYTVVNGKYIRPDGKIGNSNVGFYTSPIFVISGETLTYSIEGFGCAILSTYNNGVYTPIVIAPRSITQYTDETYTATEDCYVAFSGTPGTLSVSSSLTNLDRLQKGLQKEIDGINKELTDVPFTEIVGKYIRPDGLIGDSEIGFYSTPIFVPKGLTLTYSIEGIGCAILSTYANNIYTPIVVAPGRITKYTNETFTADVDCYVAFSGTPGTLVVGTSRIRSLEIQAQSIRAPKANAEFYETIRAWVITPEGTIQSGGQNNCLFLIPGGRGFYLELSDGYQVDSSHLFDEATATLIQSNFVGNGSWVPLNIGNRAIYGQDTTICGQFLAVVIKKSDGSVFSADELNSVIKEYGRLDNPHLHRWIINEPYFQYAHKRMRAITNIQWLCKEKVQAVTTAYNNVRFLRGEQYNGVPYSDVSEKNKYVGVYVTPYTFLTAAANKRSLVYTENLYARTSGYGIIYDSAVRVVGCYYGSVCSGFTAAIMGLPLVYLVKDYAPNGNVPNLTTIQSADDIQPLDLIYYNGHISIVSDIYKDDYGKIKYILWAEYNYPNIFINVYTVDSFKERLLANNAVIRRYTDWGVTCTDIEIPDEIPADVFDYARPQLKESDIYVFAGDKACFSIDDPIYLNLNREKGYTNLLVYKDDSQTPFLNVDISQLSADNMYEGEDWVKYDLRIHELGVGKFRAVLYDGSDYSDNAYFEIIDTTATLEISDSIVNTVSFTASNCVPIAAISSSQNYYANSIKIFTDQEIESGVASLNWDVDTRSPYITVLFKGEYGVAQKRLNVGQ